MFYKIDLKSYKIQFESNKKKKKYFFIGFTKLSELDSNQSTKLKKIFLNELDLNIFFDYYFSNVFQI